LDNRGAYDVNLADYAVIYLQWVNAKKISDVNPANYVAIYLQLVSLLCVCVCDII